MSGLNTPPVSGGGTLPRPESESSYAALRAAGQELMEIALQEGIDSHAPLGRWIRTLKVAMDAQALLCLAVSRETREANTVADSSLAARTKDLETREQVMQDLTAQLTQSFEAVRTLHLSTETRRCSPQENTLISTFTPLPRSWAKAQQNKRTICLKNPVSPSAHLRRPRRPVNGCLPCDWTMTRRGHRKLP